MKPVVSGGADGANGQHRCSGASHAYLLINVVKLRKIRTVKSTNSEKSRAVRPVNVMHSEQRCLSGRHISRQFVVYITLDQNVAILHDVGRWRGALSSDGERNPFVVDIYVPG